MAKIGYVLAVASALVSTPACAQSFPGARVEVNLGWDHVGGKLSYSDSAAPANDFNITRSTDGVVYGGTVGYDLPIGNGIYVGVESSIDFASNKKCEALVATSSACFSAKRNIAVGARVGTRVTRTYLAYIGAAYVNGKATVSYTDTTTPANDVSGSDTRDGYRIFAGVEHRLVANSYAKIEYRYSNYSNYTASVGTQSASLGFDRHQIVAGVGLRF